VNGVCHQAANRILLPASMTVSTARGYWVSESIFGTYGRVGAWRCHAPFHKHAGVSGDLAECRSALPATGGRDAAAEASEKQKRERDYLQGVLKLYAAAEDGRRPRSETLADVQEFQQTLFLHMVQFRLGALLNEELSRRLREVNARAEAARSRLSSARRGKVVAVHEYVEAFNRETIKFQEEMANALSAEQYEALFGLKPGEAIVLADPEIVKKAARE
jgi:hypothetical protein